MDQTTIAPPVQAQLLGENIAKLSAKDQIFASSLLTSLSSKGALSAKQWHWVGVLAERATKPAQPAETVQVGDVAGIVALIGAAQKSGLKRPAVLLSVGNATARISVAGPASKYVGQIMVTSGARDAQTGMRTWFGRITQAGAFLPSMKLEAAQKAELIVALTALSADPEGVAAEFGKKTGACCFCASPLTDGTSVALGYGPICAQRWGLDHSKAAALKCEEVA